jgi:cytochrome oxidase Cu insertion factor (SCO1/SenC/PrrC family)
MPIHLDVPDPTGPAKPTAKSGRIQALLILLICAAPIVGGTFAFMVWDQGQTTNYGELVTPRKVEIVGQGIDRKPTALSKHEGKWRLVIFDGGHCDEQCQRKLLYTRQIRLAQGREQTRIERIWFIDDGSIPNPEHTGLYAEAHLINLPPGFASTEFEKQGSPRQYIYLVDPLGHLMMRYSADPDPAKMIKDLQRILKYSRIG